VVWHLGLYRFDGYSFKTYQHETTEYSTVSNNYIYSMVEDINGNLWIGTNGGLNIYIYNTGSFHLLTNKNSGLALPVEKVTAIAAEKTNIVWIGSPIGLSEITINLSGKITGIRTYPFKENKNGLTETAINHILIDHHHLIWVITDEGIYILDKGKNAFCCFKMIRITQTAFLLTWSNAHLKTPTEISGSE
jgi:ligand-binding sensor domain-containing protein